MFPSRNCCNFHPRVLDFFPLLIYLFIYYLLIYLFIIYLFIPLFIKCQPAPMICIVCLAACRTHPDFRSWLGLGDPGRGDNQRKSRDAGLHGCVTGLPALPALLASGRRELAVWRGLGSPWGHPGPLCGSAVVSEVCTRPHLPLLPRAEEPGQDSGLLAPPGSTHPS